MIWVLPKAQEKGKAKAKKSWERLCLCVRAGIGKKIINIKERERMYVQNRSIEVQRDK